MKLDERDSGYIQRIIEHCERIMEAKDRFGNSFKQYRDDADYRDVVCMNIFQIGELANQITDTTQEELQDIPWSKMYGIRNILAHAYIKIDDQIVWDTMENDICPLKDRLESILNN